MSVSFSGRFDFLFDPCSSILRDISNYPGSLVRAIFS
jgi:hypothetical protein